MARVTAKPWSPNRNQTSCLWTSPENLHNWRTGQDSNLRDGLRRLPTFQAGAFSRSATCPWRRGRDLNPEALAGLPAFEAGAFSRALLPLYSRLVQPDGAAPILVRTARFELATGMPAGFKPAASTGSATSACQVRKCFSIFAPRSQRSRMPDGRSGRIRTCGPSSQTRCATRLRYTPALRAVRVCRFSPPYA